MKELSEDALEDIQKKVGGSMWIETLDVYCGQAPYSFIGGPLNFCEQGDFPGWHILLTNADAGCTQETPYETWTGGVKEFYPVPYQRDDVAENNGASGGVVTSVKLGDTGGVIADFMDKMNGLVGKPVFLSMHYKIGMTSRYINIAAPEITYEFTVKDTSHDKTYAKVSLATAIPLDRQWPPRKTSKAKCRWVFKGCECQYDGNEESCAHTIAACRTLGNIVHFGAFPGCGVGGLAQ